MSLPLPHVRGSNGNSDTGSNSSSETFIRAATVRERLTAVGMKQLTIVGTFETHIRFRPLAAHSKWRASLFKNDKLPVSVLGIRLLTGNVSQEVFWRCS